MFALLVPPPCFKMHNMNQMHLVSSVISPLQTYQEINKADSSLLILFSVIKWEYLTMPNEIQNASVWMPEKERKVFK